MQGGRRATAAQKRLWDELTNIGCLFQGIGVAAEIHHPVGTVGDWVIRDTFERVQIGNWFVLAIGDGPHRNWANNITHRPREFFNNYRKNYGDKDLSDLELQKLMYQQQAKRYELYYDKPYPVPDNIMTAITEYGRKKGVE